MKTSPEHEQPNHPPPPAKPRRRRKRLLVALSILVLTAAFGIPAVNGPVFRAVLRAALDKGAAAANVTGTAEVSGTLWSGPRLANGSFEGTGALLSVRFETLEVDYDPVKLAREGVFEGLAGIRTRGLAVVLAKQKDGGTEEENAKDDGDDSGGAWKYTAIRNVPIQLQNVSFQLLEDGNPVWQIDGLDFTLEAGGRGELALARVLAPGEKSYESLRAALQINESSLEIADLALLDDVRVERLLVEKHDVLPAIANGSLSLFGGRVALEYTPDEQVRATLTEGAIDLARLDALLGLEKIESGSVTALDARLLNAVDLAVEGSVAVEKLRVDGHSVDAARAAVRFSAGRLNVDSFEVISGENRLEGAIALAIPREPKGAPDWLEDLTGNLTLRTPRPETILEEFEVPLAGNIEADIAFAFAGGVLTRLDGPVRGAEVAFRDISIPGIEAILSCPRPGVPAVATTIRLDPGGANSADVKAEFAIETLRYEATASVALPALAALEMLLESAGVKSRLAGHAQADWNGSGDLREKEHRGKLALTDVAVRIGDGEEIRGASRLAYDPGGFEASDLDLSAGEFTLRGGADLRGDVLTLAGIRLSRGETALVNAEATLPFRTDALKSPRAFLAQEGPVAVAVRCETLSIEEIYRTVLPEAIPPVGGLFSGKLDASGSLPELKLDAALKLAGVAHPSLPKASPAEIEAAVTVDAGRLRLAASARQELIAPISVSGDTAFTPRLWIEDPESWKKQDIALLAELPETDLAVFLPFLPAISRLEGNASAKMRVEGTAGEPRFSGGVTSAIARVKFVRQEIPTITGLDFALALEGQEVRVERGRAEVAGGLLELDGGISFEGGLADPALSLTLRAEQALVARDDYLNLRANADLALTGPFSAATLSGEIAIAESRYVRDIEILPLNFLRRTPALPTKASALKTSNFQPAITAPPFDRWVLDLRIVTADPFLIRGNRANASATADIAVTGTGAAPVATGKMTIPDGEAKLPFSKLKVERGELVFEESGGFIPRLNIETISTIRQYELRIKIYGSALDPKVLLTSNPPLPQEDIATLLASGSTREELGDREAVASKALQLVVRETAGKIFRRKSSADRKELLPEELEFSIGQTDARTGRRAASSIYRVTPNALLIGTLDEAGDYRGLVKFLIRFR